MLKDGYIVVNKPKAVTSHDVVDLIRRKFKLKKVGHAGTLDPMATGVLVILLGNCTKLFDKFLTFEKEYCACLHLGSRTSTGDIEGEVLETKSYEFLTEEAVLKAMSGFVGEVMQVPPMVAAIKYKGKPLYELARKGIEVPRKARKIMIKELKLLSYCLPDIRFYLKCSRGTYVRQLGDDLAQKLETSGCISEIERVGVGRFKLVDALKLEEITEKSVKPLVEIC